VSPDVRAPSWFVVVGFWADRWPVLTLIPDIPDIPDIDDRKAQVRAVRKGGGQQKGAA
jgi:hypothetical protein